MKSKKVMIIISVVLLIVIAIIIGIHKFYSSYIFNEDGTVSNSYNLYYEQLNNLSGDERIKLIEFGVEHNIITRQKADEYLKENK